MVFKKKFKIQFLIEKSNVPDRVVNSLLWKKLDFFNVCLSFGHVEPVSVVTHPVLAVPSLPPPP